jgi:CPA2 family monovalent cation:H+ antiporter-2
MTILAAQATTQQPLVLVLLLLLCAAAIVIVLCRWRNVEPIPGYLIAGAIIGPHALALIKSETAAGSVTDLATVILLFTIGLQFDAANFRRGALSIVLISIVSTLLYLAAFWAILLALGLAAPVALALAMAGCSASTAITLRILQQRRELHEAHGRVSMGFSILDDLTGVIMLACFPLIAGWAGTSINSDPSDWSAKVFAAARSIGGVALMLALAAVLLPRLMQRIAALRSPETILIVSAAIALLCGAWTATLGFSAEMGAFLAGVVLAGTPLRYQIVGQLGSTRDLLMAIFFLSVGLVVDPALVLSNAPLVLGLAAALMVVKLSTTALCCWIAGMTARGSVLTGVYNINAGEFTFVLLAAATSLTIISQEHAALAIAAAAITLIATPLIVSPAHALAGKLSALPLAPWVRSSALLDPAPSAPGPESQPHTDAHSAPSAPPAAPTTKPRHVIIAGFGPGGRAIADRLESLHVPYVVVELNASTVTRQNRAGRSTVFGDIANPDVLEAAGIDRADAVIITIPDDDAALRAVQAVRTAAPDTFIGVRTQFLSGKMRALSLGASEVVVAEVAVAAAMDTTMFAALSAHLCSRPNRSDASPNQPTS